MIIYSLFNPNIHLSFFIFYLLWQYCWLHCPGQHLRPLVQFKSESQCGWKIAVHTPIGNGVKGGHIPMKLLVLYPLNFKYLNAVNDPTMNYRFDSSLPTSRTNHEYYQAYNCWKWNHFQWFFKNFISLSLNFYFRFLIEYIFKQPLFIRVFV